MFFAAATAAGATFTLATHRLDDVTVVRCRGRITLGSVETLRAVVKQAPTPVVVLDLAETTAIDAAGLGVLVSLRHRAQATGTTLKLMNLRPMVERLLELTGLKPAFAICSVPEMFDLLCRAMRRPADETADFIPRERPVIATGGPVA
jgi:anti-sigma B factor antagonist